MDTNQQYDAVIIGGGPAGATTATILAMKGRRVLVLEREHFPRYKIGESLIPYCYFTLERLGVIPKLTESIAQKKYNVQFVREDGRVSAPFYFNQHLKHEASMTWQVRRDDFDMMMLDNAREHGVEVIEGINVKEAIREGDTVVGVIAEDQDGNRREFRAQVTVDASGRDAFTINRNDWKVPDPMLKKVAIWTYYKGAKRDPGIDEGATTVAYLPDKGWFWYLPLPNDEVSVGITAEREYLYRDLSDGKRDPEFIFNREIENNEWIREHLSTGEQFGGYRVTGDYSYRSKYCATDGVVLVGDAFAFLDPVFSSGVFLALRSGEVAADHIDEALTRGDVSASAFAEYGEMMCEGMEAMRKLVYAFYDDDFSFGKMLKKYPHLKGDVTDCLIGHLFKDFTEMWQAASEFAEMPEPLEHGRPLVEAST